MAISTPLQPGPDEILYRPNPHGGRLWPGTDTRRGRNTLM